MPMTVERFAEVLRGVLEQAKSEHDVTAALERAGREQGLDDENTAKIVRVGIEAFRAKAAA